jgi:MFS transporter, FSR family, fosmidomycin resistance protein
MSPLSPPARPADSTVFPVILAIAFCHMANDLMQSLIPAIYPLIKAELTLTFAQIGMITFVFQGTASVLQPIIGYVTDRRPLPYALPCGMAMTLAGIILLSHAHSFGAVLAAVALIGMGSSVFHPDSSRIARLAAGPRPGLAQSVFQVGGNAGSALGPLAAALIVVPFGQTSLEWFGIVALVGIGVLIGVGRWYAVEGLRRMQVARARREGVVTLPRRTVTVAMAILILLMFSKFVYTGAYSSYYTFYLIERFGLAVPDAQFTLFVFLAFVALGTIIGGPIGDRIGRKRVIWVSILGVAPLSLLIPHVGFWPTVVLSSLAGMILASAFPAMVVYAQDLLPSRVGMIAGLFFGFAFGMGAIGAAVIGVMADATSITYVFWLTGFLPLLGVLAVFLPDVKA